MRLKYAYQPFIKIDQPGLPEVVEEVAGRFPGRSDHRADLLLRELGGQEDGLPFGPSTRGRLLEQELSQAGGDVAEGKVFELALQQHPSDAHDAGYQEGEYRDFRHELFEVVDGDCGDSAVSHHFGHRVVLAGVDDGQFADQLSGLGCGNYYLAPVLAEPRELDYPLEDQVEVVALVAREEEDVAAAVAFRDGGVEQFLQVTRGKLCQEVDSVSAVLCYHRYLSPIAV